MNKPSRLQLASWVSIGAGCVLSGLIWFYHQSAVQSAEDDVTVDERHLASVYTEDLDLRLEQVSQQAELLTHVLGDVRGDTAQLETRLVQALQGVDASRIYGLGVWFEPSVFQPDGKRFQRFMAQPEVEAAAHGIKVEWLHAQDDFYQSAWYGAAVRAKGEAVYTEPYFDVSEAYITVARSFQTQEGKLAGVVTVDMLLPQLRQLLTADPALKGRWLIVRSPGGALIHHPRHAEILQIANQAGWRINDMVELQPAQLQSLARHGGGQLLHPSGYRYIDFTMRNAGWKVTLAVPETEWAVPARKVRQDHLISQIVLWAAVLSLLFFFRVQARRQRQLEREKAEAEEQRAAAQMEIWQMAERFEMLFLTNLDGVFLLEEHGMSEVNRAAIGMLGASDSSTLLNTPPRSLFPRKQPDGQRSWPTFLRHLRQAAQRGNHRFEFEFKRLDGSLFPAEVVVNNMHLEHGFMLQMMLRDISERKAAEREAELQREEERRLIEELQQTQGSLLREAAERQEAEESLRDSEAMLSSMIQTANDAIIMITGEGYVELWNKAATHMFGYAQEEALGQHIHTLITPERYRATGNAAMMRFAQTGVGAVVGKTIEIEATDKTGREFPVELSITAFQRHDAWHAVAMIRDIEERKVAEQRLLEEKAAQQKLIDQLEQAQNQLLQSEKMAAIGQLAAGVAHEINNPTGFVASNLNSLGKYLNDLTGLNQIYLNAEGELSEATRGEVARYKKQIDYDFLLEDTTALLTESRDGIDRVKRIVQDLKDFSHVDEGEWLLVDLHKGLDSTLNVVRNEIKYKADVVKEYGELPTVETIPSQLNQVFLNILVNAAQAIDGFGAITLRSGAAEDRVWISIQDTGKGINPENLKRIFDPFFTTKPVGQGTGLGLSLVFGIMKKLGGYITVSSEVGVGTCFTIHLPVRRGEVLVAAEA
ncbi:PAS domain S-box protein [Leeia aquatica]|uniref:histidine kinase n=1 Tax=Leeia aquatica TaxID=2725557 RepID=A0A847S8H7_9NEIS|nr:PAS domain S-box protein [Leeia aquatica]NLR76274.1 PAS domain S-box protein [Leeia aquatica]